MKKVFANTENHISEANVPWPKENIVRDDFHVVIYKDGFPCTEGHLLFVPKYNSIDVLRDAISDAIEHGINGVEGEFWDGFNVGVNYGKAAGQTVAWPHVHLIPRRNGDVEDPTGGIRNIIPGKGNYRA